MCCSSGYPGAHHPGAGAGHSSQQLTASSTLAPQSRPHHPPTSDHQSVLRPERGAPGLAPASSAPSNILPPSPMVSYTSGVTILYLKWNKKSHLNFNFEIGRDFLGIWVLCVPKEHKNRVLMRKFGLFASLRNAKIEFLTRKLGLFASQRKNFGGLLKEKWGKYFLANTI